MANLAQLEPETRHFLETLENGRTETGAALLDVSNVEALRSSMASFLRTFGPRELPVSKSEQRTIVADDRTVPVRICWPRVERGGSARLPILVYFHGGGWTHFSAETHENVARYLCSRAECIVVNVDYRLAPENKFPAALDDAYAAVCWASTNAASLGGDDNAIVVAGESAGGTLSIGVCVLAKRNGTPRIALQIPLCPSLTLENYAAYDSWKRLGNGDYLLSQSALDDFKHAYLSDNADAINPLASPILVEDLADLPPTLMISAEFDPLIDEEEQFVERLRRAGVPVDYRCFRGTVHSFMILAGAISLGYRALDEIAERVKALKKS